MNGARSIFVRKGYWLTALAAIVLLAASPGTASAQVTVTATDEVTEGDIATYTVAIKGFIPDATRNPTATVTLNCLPQTPVLLLPKVSPRISTRRY